MGNAARQQRNEYWLSVEGKARLHVVPAHSPNSLSRRKAPRTLAIKSHSATASSEMAVLGIILAFLQVADGVLTGLGMAHYGTAMEGNILLRELMLLIGFVPALVVVKTAAIGVVTGLCLYAYSVTWLRSAFKVVIGLYVLLAVLPWSVILATEYFA